MNDLTYRDAVNSPGTRDGKQVADFILAVRASVYLDDAAMAKIATAYVARLSERMDD